jgi:DNA-binding response OmpR family regulator
LEDNLAGSLIAVINHDPVFLRLMEAVLKAEGYEVLVISDGSTAYEIIKRDRPEAIVLDTWLADRQAGWDLIQVIRLDAATARIPTLICSSDDRDDVVKRLGKNTLQIQVIHKPFDTSELIAAIKKTLALGPQRISSDGSRPGPLAS